MSINNDVFKALLALDSYNRGYNQGIIISGSTIGNASLTTNSYDALPDSETASFFAQAYSWNGETIISYRGTDKIWPSVEDWTIGDLAGGWGVGAGDAGAPQAELAVEFFKTVAGGDPVNANIELTGHSLGGGASFLRFVVRTVFSAKMPYQSVGITILAWVFFRVALALPSHPSKATSMKTLREDNA